MFDELREKLTAMADGVRETTDSLTASVQSAHQDLLELRDIFVSIRDFVSSAVSFMGREAVVLLVCTTVFLFVLNLVPFLFFSKKFRYYTGIVFGVCVGAWLSYSFVGVAKFVLIMLLPVLIEYAFIFISKKSFGFLGKSFKSMFSLALNGTKTFLKATNQRLFDKKAKESDEEKSS